MTGASPPYTAQSPACIFLVRPLCTPFGRYVLLLSIRVLQKNRLGGLLNVHHTVRGYEKAGAAAIQLEDQETPKK